MLAATISTKKTTAAPYEAGFLVTLTLSGGIDASSLRERVKK